MSATLGSAAALRLEDLDYALPEDLVAQRPLADRDACRLLCVRRGEPGRWTERTFRDLPDLLRPGDVLVRNVTRVVPARLRGRKHGTGAGCEIVLLEPARGGAWWALVRPARRLPPGSQVVLDDGTTLEVQEAVEAGRRLVSGPRGCDLQQLAARAGAMPLPPYIRREADAADTADYQTVYARADGSVAAPTAGLHFTTRLFSDLESRGVVFADLILHVGPGTFQPIRSSDPGHHAMHSERFEIEATALARIDVARARGGRVVAVGTTVVRALESLAVGERGGSPGIVEYESAGGRLTGRTRLFIRPPHVFRRVDALITNFHLPRSTLLLLVDAFAGRETIRAAYAHAVARRFRFLSYGDAMWIE